MLGASELGLVKTEPLLPKARSGEFDGEPFNEKMKRLTSELSDLFAKSHELEAQIKKNLKAIGFEVK